MQTAPLHRSLHAIHRIEKHRVPVFQLIGCRRNNTQHKRSHLSLDVKIVLLPTASAPGLSLWAAVLALVVAAVRGALRTAVVEVAAASSHLFCVSNCCSTKGDEKARESSLARYVPMRAHPQSTPNYTRPQTHYSSLPPHSRAEYPNDSAYSAHSGFLHPRPHAPWHSIALSSASSRGSQDDSTARSGGSPL